MSRIYDWFTDPDHQIFTLVLLVLFCILIEETIHLYFGIESAYTHVFYVVLVLAAIWYHERAVYLAIALGFVHILVSYYELGVLTWPPLLRMLMFILVTWIVAWLSAKKDEFEKELVRSKKEIEEKHEALTAYLTEITNRIRHPVEIVNNNLHQLALQVEREGPPDDLSIRLHLQIRNTEQIIRNLSELNQEVLSGDHDIPDAYREFLTR
ncbi:MAG TPA: hypothetical protein VMC42_07210 [Methanoregulaceae archaeon]|nr:hypothetical protein [Methanoregulaceae archaeon]